MMRIARLSLIVLATLPLVACFGGAKAPSSMFTLTSSATEPSAIDRSASPGNSIIIDVPVIPKELATTRVPAIAGSTAIAYIKDLTWVETPDRLFQRLVQETVIRSTNRVVLDPRQSALEVGQRLSGSLTRFGYDANEGAVVVRYDAALTSPGGETVKERRFEAKESADGTAATVGPALNDAANKVAADVAAWIGSQ